MNATTGTLPWVVIEETIRGMHARSESTGDILGFLYDSQTGRGRVRIGSLAGVVSVRFSVVDGVVFYASQKYWPTIY